MNKKTLKKIIEHIFFRSRLYRFMVIHFPKKAHEIRWNFMFNKPINWKNPSTLNEKIQWLEVYTDTTLWTKYADKYEVRQHLEELGFGQYLTKLYGVWDKVEDIDYSQLPNQFVIKCTHDFHSTYIVEDKNQLNISELNEKLNRHMSRTFGYFSCEPHYTRIKPRIIAEELLGANSQTGSLIDFKFCCINSNVEFCLVCYDRPATGEHGNAIRNIYKIEPWVPTPQVFTPRFTPSEDIKIIEKPENLSEMIDFCHVLSNGFPLVYIDLYNIDGRIVFGEMTFTRDAGRIIYMTDEYQKELGAKIILPSKK